MRTIKGMLMGAVFASLAVSVAQAQTPDQAFRMVIDAFSDGGEIPVQFSQAAPGAAPGEGDSPLINWENVPEGTRSFMLHMHDLDVAVNRSSETQVHWVVWNIPADETGLAEGLPRGAQLPNGASQVSATGMVYRGPGAPASRPPHHYLFELYALDAEELDVEPSDDAFATRAEVLEAIEGRVLGKAVYMGRFSRPE